MCKEDPEDCHPNFSDTLRKMNTYTSFEAERLVNQHLSIGIWHTLEFLIVKPVATFLLLVVRHKGIVDGLSGILFGLMSALHHPITYLKVWEHYERLKKTNHIN